MNKVHIILECEGRQDCDETAGAIAAMLQNNGKRWGVNGWIVEGKNFKARTSHTTIDDISREVFQRLNL